MPSSSVPERVDARQAVGERRVHVEMRIDERRRDEVAARRRWPRPASASDRGSIAAIVLAGMPISAVRPSGRVRVRDDQIEAHGRFRAHRWPLK